MLTVRVRRRSRLEIDNLSGIAAQKAAFNLAMEYKDVSVESV